MTFLKKLLNKIKHNFMILLVLAPIFLFVLGFVTTSLIIWISGNTNKEASLVVEESTQAEETTLEEPLILNALEMDDSKLYILQIASFTSESGAKSSVDQFEEKGLQSNWIKIGSQYRVFSVLTTEEELIRSYRLEFIEQYPEHSDAFVTSFDVSYKPFQYTATESDVQAVDQAIKNFYNKNNGVWVQLLGSEDVSSTLIESSISDLQQIVEKLSKYEENIDTDFTKLMDENYSRFLSLKTDNAPPSEYMKEFSRQLLNLTTQYEG